MIAFTSATIAAKALFGIGINGRPVEYYGIETYGMGQSNKSSSEKMRPK